MCHLLISFLLVQGNLDPIDGFVVYSMLQGTNAEGTSLAKEISDYQKIVRVKAGGYHSSDPLDLGMTLWTTSHWSDAMSETIAWRNSITESAVKCLREFNIFSFD